MKVKVPQHHSIVFPDNSFSDEMKRLIPVRIENQLAEGPVQQVSPHLVPTLKRQNALAYPPEHGNLNFDLPKKRSGDPNLEVSDDEEDDAEMWAQLVDTFRRFLPILRNSAD